MVIKVHWTYTNDEGSIGGVHTLPTPEGDVPLNSVTAVLAVSWLLATARNTAAALETALTRIAALEADDATLMNNNGGH